MSERDLHQKELIEKIDSLQKTIAMKRHEKDSLEWYLGNHLDSYLKVMGSDTPKVDMERADHIFGRFCIDSMDWDTSIFKECSAIRKLGGHLIKLS